MPADAGVIGRILAGCGPLPVVRLCITLPGGLTVCAFTLSGDELEILISLLGQMNAALAPLGPIFTLIDLLLAIVKCIQAIPQSLLPPNPQPIFDCIVGLAKALADVLKLIPFISLPFTLLGILDALIALLTSLLATISFFAAKTIALVNAATTPIDPNGALIIKCEQDSVAAELASLNEAFKPLNRFLGIVNLFLQLIGQQGLPSFASIAGNPTAALAPVESFLAQVKSVRALIPIPVGATA